MRRLLLCLGLLVGNLTAAHASTDLPDGLYAEIVTPHGTMIAELDYAHAPLTVTNFVGLAEGTLGPHPGTPFFDGLTFNRVVPGFVVQGGDPLGNGDGGPGYEFPDELSSHLRHDRAGILSMANSGPDTNGSQFFITLAPTPHLDYLHSVFGAVVEGLSVLPQIAAGDPMTVKIRRIGAAAVAIQADPATFAALATRQPRAVPAHLEDPDGLLPTVPTNWARIINHRLANLTRFTGAQCFIALHPKRAPDDANAKPGEIAHRYAERCGAAADGFTAVYFADRAEWALWIGAAQLERFNPDGLPLHEVKQALLTAVAAEATTSLAQRFPAGDAPPDQKLKRQVDALIHLTLPLLAPDRG